MSALDSLLVWRCESTAMSRDISLRSIKFTGRVFDVDVGFARSQQLAARSCALSKFYGQATKGAWWMPWQKKAMKDVASCDKPREAASRHLIRGCPNGETHYGKTVVPPTEFIGREERTQGSEPSQYLKEKKETSIPIVVASELGTAQTYFTLLRIDHKSVFN